MLAQTDTIIRASDVKKENGVVYTPSNLATFVAQKVIAFSLRDMFDLGLDLASLRAHVNNFKILDPACGEGELLIAAWNEFYQALLEDKRGEALAKSLMPSNILYGVDIDEKATSATSRRITQLQLFSNQTAHNVLTTNALLPDCKEFNIESVDDLKRYFGAKDGFDILIANPPWGASTASYNEKLLTSTFTLNRGQYDTSDLFVELAISLTKRDGYFAFIIPDSLFGHERKWLRKLLLEKTEIKYIGRLGEKIFENINRACVVIVCKKTHPRTDSRVDCMRLNPQFRKIVLRSEMSYLEADRLLVHSVQQNRFLKNEEFLFDIDTREEEASLLDKITGAGKTIGEYVSASRGVELSKSGKICKCDECNYWMPRPSSLKAQCLHCSAPIDLERVETRTIISKEQFKGSRPILVGESVGRYFISSRYWISLENEGINYKSISMYYEPKILVRKTGVGITATIDYSSALTNQVVYIFRLLNNGKNVPIEFILAVMNSRALYYYLLKKYGEMEWRTHPYLTQSQILSLPLPYLDSPEAKMSQKIIVKLLKPFLKKQLGISKVVDAKVERLIASMFGLSRKDYELIYRTLNSTQGLIPIKALSGISVSDIFN